ncbi:acetate/propionate family kinase [Buchnera aphidicola (Kurisakia onigurumii)]
MITMLKDSILVLNCGSSSIKFSIFQCHTNKKFLSGIIESIGSNESNAKWITNNKKKYCKYFKKNNSYKSLLKFLFRKIIFKETKISKSLIGIGHRIVHGGTKIKKAIFLNKKNIHYINKISHFAPLHNPINLLGINISIQELPNLSNFNIGVFDTSFHQTIQKESYLYAIPYKMYSLYNIRRYGAHGISHKYIVSKSSEILNKSIKKLNIISCHLGNGASVTAIVNGISIDTSMGLTPLEGLVMGTRSGDIDPSIIFFMFNKLKMNIKEIENTLINKSGLLGINEKESDCRKIINAYSEDKKFELSINIFCRRLAKYISSYMCLMKEKLDGLIFTGGIGENSCLIRSNTVFRLLNLGFKLDDKKNKNLKKKINYFINAKNSIPILVIKTEEELEIARETWSLIYANRKK